MANGPVTLKKILREPLLHFAILGGLIFAFQSGAELPAIDDVADRIVISGADVGQLQMAWTKRWQRPPNDEEMRAMIRDSVREQVLYKEALALGLDRDDVVIRRHLGQKFEFVTQDLVYDTNPDDATLRAYYTAHPERYVRSARLSFQQILFSPHRRGEKALTDATLALDDLRLVNDPRAADLLGDPTSLPHDFDGISDRDVSSMFGPEFAAAVLELQPGEWSGPILSGYGAHLVRLSGKVSDHRLQFEDVRQNVIDDWVYDQRVEANEALFRKLLARYEVVVEPVVTPPPIFESGS